MSAKPMIKLSTYIQRPGRPDPAPDMCAVLAVDKQDETKSGLAYIKKTQLPVYISFASRTMIVKSVMNDCPEAVYYEMLYRQMKNK